MTRQAGEGIQLVTALRAGRGDVVAFVGGGGKTTSMFRLAAGLCAAGLRVVTTTTTHISQEQVQFAPVSIGIDDLGSLKEQLDRHGQCLVIGAPDGKGRVFGASSELIAELSARPDIDAVIVEADGSRSRPFKAPGEHEPVVPENTTILVPIAGLNAIGQSLDEIHVHRSEIAASLAQVPVGSPVTAETVARVLSHPQGGAKQRPDGAKLVPLLNRADTDDAVRQAGEVAEKLLANPAVDTVIINSMQQEPSVREAWVPSAGIVLAAGASAGSGAARRGLPWGDITRVGTSARAALDAGLDPVIVVLGQEPEKVERELAGLSVRTVFYPEFSRGPSCSLRRGLEALPSRTGTALVLYADQPFVTAGLIETIVRAHRRTFAPVCVPVFEGRYGNPVLFDKAVFSELRALSGDTGVRELLDRYADALVSLP